MTISLFSAWATDMQWCAWAICNELHIDWVDTVQHINHSRLENFQDSSWVVPCWFTNILTRTLAQLLYIRVETPHYEGWHNHWRLRPLTRWGDKTKRQKNTSLLGLTKLLRVEIPRYEGWHNSSGCFLRVLYIRTSWPFHHKTHFRLTNFHVTSFQNCECRI